MGDFFKRAIEYVKGWSEDQIPEAINHIPFSLESTITLPMEIAAFNWARLKVFVRNVKNETFYIQTKNQEKSFPMSEVTEYERQAKFKTWRKFETYTKFQTQFSKVKMDGDNWKDASFSCDKFQKIYACTHVLGIAVRMKSYSVRPEAKNIPIGVKRKRRRPKLAKKALLSQ